MRPPLPLAWDGRALGSTGYHRWEVQSGQAARLMAPAMRRALHRQHQIWLENLVRHTQRNLT
ncbi:hypothetical protein [Streptomyces sp. CA-251251]|uniref:hypothetical protein n=1 Tax=Streptomyces sp. CA-251251 TaxID=3240063 RepID=UPI003D8CD6BD